MRLKCLSLAAPTKSGWHSLYKTVSRNMQRGAGRDTSRTVRPYQPRSRAEHRKWWYPVVEHHAKTGVDLFATYRRKLPAWLATELRNFTIGRWLGYWVRIPDHRGHGF